MSVPGRVIDLVERERTIIQHRIDRLAHELYGLSHEEIEIVEQESPQRG
jgi:hypothetical protein